MHQDLPIIKVLTTPAPHIEIDYDEFSFNLAADHVFDPLFNSFIAVATLVSSFQKSIAECHHVVATLLREPSCAPLDPDFVNLLYDTSPNDDVCDHSSYDCSAPQVYVIFSDIDSESQDTTVHPEPALLVTALDRIRQGAADSVGILPTLAANLYDRSPLVSFEPFVDESSSSLSSLDASTATRSSSFIWTPVPIVAS